MNPLLIRLLRHILTFEDVDKATIEEESPEYWLVSQKTHFHNIYGRSFPSHHGLHAVLLIVSVVCCLAITISYSVEIIKDSLLIGGCFSFNENGAIRVQLPASKEYDLFLFNTSDLWADSGIELRRGDRIKVGISGAFHPSIAHLKLDAQHNATNHSFQHQWVFADTPIGHDSLGKRFRLFENEPFGSIIYRVGPRLRTPKISKGKDYYKIYQPRGARFTRVNKDGVLQFAVNDIYFEDTDKLKGYARNNPYRFIYPQDTVIIYPETYFQVGPRFHRSFYDDNLGQLLVGVEIWHPLCYFNPLRPLRTLTLNTNNRFIRLAWCLIVWARVVWRVALIAALLLCFAVLLTVFIWFLIVFGSPFLISGIKKVIQELKQIIGKCILWNR